MSSGMMRAARIELAGLARRVLWKPACLSHSLPIARPYWLTPTYSMLRSVASTTRNRGNEKFVYTPNVQDALSGNDPVVALESTIISHGMPYPQNLETALAVEEVVREHGSVPATIAVLDGRVHVGLTHSELERLARLGSRARKTSRRDLSLVTSQCLTGATTVSGTMVIAHRAGIPILVTGGIGGVHRGGENTMDISADLTELGRTPMAVICAGAKSILDIKRTLEYLETQGVTVATYGETDDFPAFFTPTSGFKSSCSLKTAEECATLIQSSIDLNLQSGMLITVPIPREAAAEANSIQRAIDRAVKETEECGIQGKDVTPFILQRVNELTTGDSLKANIALIKNNARAGAHIAKQLHRLLPVKASDIVLHY